MESEGSIIVIGGSSGIGREIARHYVASGRQVLLTSRQQDRADATARQLGGRASGMELNLAEPSEVAGRLGDPGRVDAVVMTAIERDHNTVAAYDCQAAERLVTQKLVGYTEVAHRLAPQMPDQSAMVLFGGLAKDRPYPGSTTVTTVNGGITSLARTLAVELAPIRVNAVDPGIVGDSPFWEEGSPEVLDGIRERTPLGRLVTMEEIVHAVRFLIDNTAVNGISMAVDGGWLLR